MLTDAEREDRKMTEKALQGRVLYRARKHGWRVMHIPRGQAGQGQWRSTGGSGKGFPDLVMARDDNRAIVVELKRELASPDEDQQVWLDLLSGAGLECYVWRPSDIRLGIVDGALE